MAYVSKHKKLRVSGKGRAMFSRTKGSRGFLHQTWRYYWESSAGGDWSCHWNTNIPRAAMLIFQTFRDRKIIGISFTIYTTSTDFLTCFSISLSVITRLDVYTGIKWCQNKSNGTFRKCVRVSCIMTYSRHTSPCITSWERFVQRMKNNPLPLKSFLKMQTGKGGCQLQLTL